MRTGPARRSQEPPAASPADRAGAGRGPGGRRWARALHGLALHGLALLALAQSGAPALAQQPESPPLDSRISEQRNQIKQLRFEKEQMLARLREFRSAEQAALQRIQRLTEAIRVARRNERELNAKREATLKLRQEQDAELARLHEQLAGARRRIGERLRRLYRVLKAGETATVFALARYGTFFRDSRYLSALREADERAIREYEALNRQVTRQQDQIEATLAELATLTTQLREDREALREQERTLRASLGGLRANQGLYRKYLADLEKVMDGMRGALERLEHERSAEARLAAQPDPDTLRGRLPPPASGTIVAAFGRFDPRYDLKKPQRGVVIRVKPEQGVKAVASGSVVHAGPFRGYEDLVVLDHGKGLFTVYGHLEGLKVRKGDWVEAAAVLGAPTYQPVDSNYSIYFEVRLNGKPEDPVQWLLPGGLSANGRARSG
ncbi:MAG: peptidoglycan DD-metalloendopeptidase family protein [Candidatus Lambdaproteobacteria bacterium]|nr:peptidoglycan DD-metalloendopeptidase family protein [Candidatus Lambdaproteobacteria bacterium]